jgi:hypothetical protein
VPSVIIGVTAILSQFSVNVLRNDEFNLGEGKCLAARRITLNYSQILKEWWSEWSEWAGIA